MIIPLKQVTLRMSLNPSRRSTYPQLEVSLKFTIYYSAELGFWIPSWQLDVKSIPDNFTCWKCVQSIIVFFFLFYLLDHMEANNAIRSLIKRKPKYVKPSFSRCLVYGEVVNSENLEIWEYSEIFFRDF